ncbi:aminoglycoside phosphotransferase (APT) family kinase protein [Paenibacillus phyllosphaerae]|uniref:Aminoglycoside phosphotransferase (APT) family kinase protein n=1 Tax=Paenibacillus phyllosphaerae TaxID=274593 RepID=A0A7W5B077_9BACL|nr:aminoglycoside phosphotransferase family protein [Paenibacillus phyllosphaerae]MBB3111872.1 aminoglycoside phosphotransferase (APT) family kinase protein [Paenibacillus phyllosphaerae]
MKEGWERTATAATLPTHELKALIQQVFPGKTVAYAEALGTGLSNTNYRIHLEGHRDPYVVRIYRSGAETARKEHAIHQLVRRKVPVADFLYMDTSRSVFDGAWAVLEWKDGTLLRDVLRQDELAETIEAAEAVGAVLARIHSFPFADSGFFGDKLAIAQPFPMNRETFLAFMENSLFHNRCGQWLGEQVTDQLWTACLMYGPLLSAIREQPVLVHADFNGLNLLMQPGTGGMGVSAVLDWEFAFAWSRYADMGNLLRYEQPGSSFGQAFLASYEAHSGSKLTRHWLLLAKLEDLIALSDMLNHATIMTPRRVADLKRLIGGTLSFLQRYEVT